MAVRCAKNLAFYFVSAIIQVSILEAEKEKIKEENKQYE